MMRCKLAALNTDILFLSNTGMAITQEIEMNYY